MWTEEKRALFQQAMCATHKLTLVQRKGIIEIPIEDLGFFLSRHIPNFDASWNCFLQPDQNSRSRCHKHLEQADNNDDAIYMKHLLAGKTKLDDRVDENQVLFLQYYVANAQVCWRHMCNAPGCVEIATKKCGRCKVAKYCCKECQKSDWKMTHKHICADLHSWDHNVSLMQKCESVIG